MLCMIMMMQRKRGIHLLSTLLGSRAQTLPLPLPSPDDASAAENLLSKRNFLLLSALFVSRAASHIVPRTRSLSQRAILYARAHVWIDLGKYTHFQDPESVGYMLIVTNTAINSLITTTQGMKIRLCALFLIIPTTTY
jgi:hypothetical protein